MIDLSLLLGSGLIIINNGSIDDITYSYRLMKYEDKKD
jgi:hypothetical protein